MRNEKAVILSPILDAKMHAKKTQRKSAFVLANKPKKK